MGEPDRMVVAKIGGLAARLSIGRDKETPRDQALAEMHAISTDPAVLGEVLGGVLYRVETEHPYHLATAELLRAAEADEAVAATTLAELLERDNRYEGGFRL